MPANSILGIPIWLLIFHHAFRFLARLWYVFNVVLETHSLSFNSITHYLPCLCASYLAMPQTAVISLDALERSAAAEVKVEIIWTLTAALASRNTCLWIGIQRHSQCSTLLSSDTVSKKLWQHFAKKDDKDGCKLCSQQFACHSSTSIMVYHLNQ